jgi:hypothetical protein
MKKTMKQKMIAALIQPLRRWRSAKSWVVRTSRGIDLAWLNHGPRKATTYRSPRGKACREKAPRRTVTLTCLALDHAGTCCHCCLLQTSGSHSTSRNRPIAFSRRDLPLRLCTIMRSNQRVSLRSTRGTACSASGTEKNSPGWNRKKPAMMFDGNTSCFMLKRMTRSL